MSPDEFRLFSIDIFGDSWVDNLCLCLRVKRRTVLRWASGERQIPDEVKAIIGFWIKGRNA